MAQQAEPNIQSFGLQKEIQEHVPDEDPGQPPQRNRAEARRTVAVNRRGPNVQRGAVELDKEESDAGAGGSDAADDLDASPTGRKTTSRDDGAEPDAEEEVEEGPDAESEEGDDADDDQNDKAAARKARDVPDKDAKTRAQWRDEVSRLTGKLEAMQRQMDAQGARSAQADDARQQHEQAASGDEMDEALDEVFDAGDKDGFVKAGEMEARGKQRKKLEKIVSGRVAGAVNDFAAEEARALLAVPGARDVYNEAVRSGAVDRLRGQHKHLAPLMFVALREQHDAQVKKLNARHEKEVGAMKEKLRRANLGEIPAGSGGRGNSGTGSGAMRPRNPMEAAMATLNQKQGLPAPRAAQRR